MMKTVKLIMTAFMAMSCAYAYAQTAVSIDQIKDMADRGVTLVEEDVAVSCVIVSDYRHQNSEVIENRSVGSTYKSVNIRTAYGVSPDGRSGLKLEFDKARYSRFVRGTCLTLRLKGALLHAKDGAYSVSGILEDMITVGEKTEPAERRVRWSEVSDADLHTLVTVEDCEFVFKDGSYMNIYEPVVRYMDTWPSLLVSGEGQPVYMWMTSALNWRRKGAGVPSGRGSVTGVLVKSSSPRYGEATGKYQIRPYFEEDIAMDWSGMTSFRTIAEWNWSDGNAEMKTSSGMKMQTDKEGLLPDIGVGLLSKTGNGQCYRSMESNALTPAAKGVNPYGALAIRAKSSDWWDWEKDVAQSVVVEFSTAGLQNGGLFFAFSFAGGCISRPTLSRYYPAFWNVEYSVDGGEFVRIASDVQMRGLPWIWKDLAEGLEYLPSGDAGMGMTEHLVSLPDETLGRQKVKVRLVPSRKILRSIAYEHTANVAARPSIDVESVINIGAVSVKFHKYE